jgi:hypothetical protein
MQSCLLLLAPMTQDSGDSLTFIASVHNVSSYTSQSPNSSVMGFLVGIRVEQVVAFLTMMRGGRQQVLSPSPRHDDAEKTHGSLCENGQF